MNMSEEEIKEKLYIKGIEAFNSHQFYDAHEYWEDLWSDYKLKDAVLIQALIQLSVGYFHITNNNRNGANGLAQAREGPVQFEKDTGDVFNVDDFLSKVGESSGKRQYGLQEDEDRAAKRARVEEDDD